MATVRVFQFQVYDITSDSYIRSKRWATHEKIGQIAGAELIKPWADIDEKYIGGEVDGMTARGFDPENPPREGFQRAVRR